MSPLSFRRLVVGMYLPGVGFRKKPTDEGPWAAGALYVTFYYIGGSAGSARLTAGALEST